jgi:hypothetical protein
VIREGNASVWHSRNISLHFFTNFDLLLELWEIWLQQCTLYTLLQVEKSKHNYHPLTLPDREVRQICWRSDGKHQEDIPCDKVKSWQSTFIMATTIFKMWDQHYEFKATSSGYTSQGKMCYYLNCQYILEARTLCIACEIKKMIEQCGLDRRIQIQNNFCISLRIVNICKNNSSYNSLCEQSLCINLCVTACSI